MKENKTKSLKDELLTEYKRDIFSIIISLGWPILLIPYRNIIGDKWFWIFLGLILLGFCFQIYSIYSLRSRELTPSEVTSLPKTIRKGSVWRGAIGGFLIGIAYSMFYLAKYLGVADPKIQNIVYITGGFGLMILLISYFTWKE